MEFRNLVIDILHTYSRQNPAVGTVLENQITNITSIDEECNGYGAYASFEIANGTKPLPVELRGCSLNNTGLIAMKGRTYELQFVLRSDASGYIDLLEIFLSDGVDWNGVVSGYTITDGESAA